MDKTHAYALAALATFAPILSCSSTPPGANPHDMGAEQHREHAEQEDQRAEGHAAQFDPDAETEIIMADTDNTFSYGTTVYNPTSHHLRSAAEHRHHATAHRDAAEALETFEAQECGSFPPKTRSACPLLGQISSAENVAQGVLEQPAQGVDRHAMLAHMRCHLAYAATHGHEGMDACPLYLKGVSVRETDGAIAIEAETPAEITAVQQRTATHLDPVK